jgi:hypothetical protein
MSIETLDELHEDSCVYCFEDTQYGSGRFVNRIPADHEVYVEELEEEILVDGYMCYECQAVDCMMCPNADAEYHTINELGMQICSDCSHALRTHFYTELCEYLLEYHGKKTIDATFIKEFLDNWNVPTDGIERWLLDG